VISSIRKRLLAELEIHQIVSTVHDELPVDSDPDDVVECDSEALTAIVTWASWSAICKPLSR